MASENKIILVGNIGEISQLKYTKKEVPVINLRLAVDDGKKPQWFDVAVFGENAYNCSRFLDKGMLVYISGKSVFEEFQGFQKHKVIAESIQFLEKKAV